MLRLRLSPDLLLALGLAAAAPLLTAHIGPAATAAHQTPGPRVVAIGDVHGAFDEFVDILQTTGLIDAKRQWVGGTAVLVQTGDIFDRGPKVRDALDLLMRLEEEARRAGGRVEPLIGNHEVMDLFHEFRDDSPATFASFADDKSEARRQRAFDEYARLVRRRATPGDVAPARETWMASHPPGFLEYVDALGPRGRYGRWVRSHKVVLTENGTAFMHAGIRPDLAGTFDDINRTVAREIRAWDDTTAMMVRAQIVPVSCTLTEAVAAAAAELRRISAAQKMGEPLDDHVTPEFLRQLQALLAVNKSPLFESEGPLWFRGFSLWPETSESRDQLVTPLLTRFGVERFVTGHTPSPEGRIVSRFDNRLIVIDTGMLTTYYKNGRASALELQNGRIAAIYTDARTPIVASGTDYLRRELLPAVFPRGSAGVVFGDRFAGAVAASAASRYRSIRRTSVSALPPPPNTVSPSVTSTMRPRRRSIMWGVACLAVMRWERMACRRASEPCGTPLSEPRGPDMEETKLTGSPRRTGDDRRRPKRPGAPRHGAGRIYITG